MQEESTTGIVPFIWISGVIVLGLVLLIILFFLLYQRRLLKQQELLREMELRRQGELMAAVIDGQENERKRLAHDLHDGVGAMLTTIRMGLWSLEKNVPTAAERSGELRSWVDDALENVRATSRDLVPPTLERAGLEDAVRMLLDRVAKSGEVQMVTDLRMTGRRCAPHAEIHLYRIIQELLSNSLRHGKPSHIRCALFSEPACIVLHYEDDGKGFDMKAADAKGLGLKNMESRAALIHGEVEVNAAPGKGIQYRIVVPCESKSQ